MKVPIESVERETLQELEEYIKEPVKRDNSWIYFTSNDWRALNELVRKQASKDIALYEEKLDRMVVIRAAGLLTRWIQKYKSKPEEERTIADKSALLGAILSLHSKDPPTGRRMLSILGD